MLLGLTCRDPKLMPYFGRWGGKFNVSTEKGKTVTDARNDLKGFLQLYGSEYRFTLKLDGEQESVEAKGNWTLAGDRIVLNVTRVNIDDHGGAASRDPNKKWIDPDVLRDSLQKQIPLLLKGKDRLEGLPMAIDKLEGQFSFEKTPVVIN